MDIHELLSPVYGVENRTGECTPEPSSLDGGLSSFGIFCGWKGE